MIGFMRLVVCGGLFAAGYYLGRQACRMESQEDQADIFGDPDATPQSDSPDPENEQSGG